MSKPKAEAPGVAICYTDFRTPPGGVLREDGTGRSCMHCRAKATVEAKRSSGRFTLYVWYCEEHGEVAKTIGRTDGGGS